MGDRVGHQADVALGCDLLHDLRLADARRPHQEHRTLSDLRNPVNPILILVEVCFDCVLDFLFCSLNIHLNRTPSLPDLCRSQAEILSILLSRFHSWSSGHTKDESRRSFFSCSMSSLGRISFIAQGGT